MYIYRGKLNFSPRGLQNAANEAITIMLPSEFSLGDPVYTCWQWSVSGNSTNVPCWLTGTIDSVEDHDADGNRIGFYGGSDYRFDGYFSRSKGIEELLLMIRLRSKIIGTTSNTKLVLYPDPGPTIEPGVIVPRIYLGRLANWAPYSVDQLLLVVIPGRIVREGDAICAFWQWTVDAAGAKKANVDFTPAKMTNVQNVADSVSFRFTTGYYTFHATLDLKETAERQQLILAMTNPSNESTGSLTLELQDLGPSPSGTQSRGVNDKTAVVIKDTTKIVGRSPNEGSSLAHSLVQVGSKMLQLTNMRLELSEKLNVLLEQAVQDRDGIIAQLESELQAAKDQIELLNTKLLETKSAGEEDRLTAQGTQDQREDDTELSDSDDVDDLNQPTLDDVTVDDFNNQPQLYDVKADDFHNNEPT